MKIVVNTRLEFEYVETNMIRTYNENIIKKKLIKKCEFSNLSWNLSLRMYLSWY